MLVQYMEISRTEERQCGLQLVFQVLCQECQEYKKKKKLFEDKTQHAV